jgi:hypothetical protein
VADQFVDRNALLICRVCKWIGEAFLWVPKDTPGGSSRIDITAVTCVACQEQGRMRVLKKRRGQNDGS